MFTHEAPLTNLNNLDFINQNIEKLASFRTDGSLYRAEFENSEIKLKKGFFNRIWAELKRFWYFIKCESYTNKQRIVQELFSRVLNDQYNRKNESTEVNAQSIHTDIPDKILATVQKIERFSNGLDKSDFLGSFINWLEEIDFKDLPVLENLFEKVGSLPFDPDHLFLVWIKEKFKNGQNIADPVKLSQEEAQIQSDQNGPVNTRLDDLALVQGYGYKSANLILLAEHTKKMNRGLNSSVACVPSFFPISDFVMQEELLKAVPDYEKLKSALISSFDSAAVSQFLNPSSDQVQIHLKVSNEGEQILISIQEKIRQFFKTNLYHSQALEDWLQANQSTFLIVRSTGKEDSDTLANAGGNESIPFVNPNRQAISDAIGQVIASYFSVKSIEQRLLAGDRTFFTDEKPFIPVLIQVMIGEDADRNPANDLTIPRSGVLFTHEIDKAEGVTVIEAGLGHNEGVVTNQVSVDTYYVGPSFKIHPVIRKKETRVVAKEGNAGLYKGHLAKSETTKLQNGAVLPDFIIQDLKRIADYLSCFYSNNKTGNQPIDMEFTIKLEEDGRDRPVIYLLQARPLVGKPQDVKPSYIDSNQLSQLSPSDVVKIKPLLVGKGAVLSIDKPSEIVFADDLPDALNRYQKASNSPNIKVIICKKTGALTSHEATTLRPTGVSVLILEDQSAYIELHSKQANLSVTTPLMIDVQRGLIIKSGMIAQNWVVPGWISYPIPLERTVKMTPLVEAMLELKLIEKGDQNLEFIKQRVQDELKALNQKYEDCTAKLSSHILENEPRKSINELIDQMKSADSDRAKEACAALIRMIYKKIQREIRLHHDGKLKMAPEIILPMLMIFDEILNIVSTETTHLLVHTYPNSFERLYGIKFIEALLFQNQTDGIVMGCSFGEALRLDKTISNEIDKFHHSGLNVVLSYERLFLQNISESAYNETCKANWLKFLDSLEQHPEKESLCQQLFNIIEGLKKNLILDLWLNIIFNNAWENFQKSYPNLSSSSQHTHIFGFVANLITEYESIEDTLNWGYNFNLILKNLEKKIDLFNLEASAQHSVTEWRQKYETDLGFAISNEVIKKRYEQTGQMGKLVVLEYLRKAIELYDHAIKTVTGSNANLLVKTKVMANLLETYFEMMQTILNLVPEEEHLKLMPRFKPSDKNNSQQKISPFRQYINKLYNGTGKYPSGQTWCFNPNHSSPGFNSLLEECYNDPSKAWAETQCIVRPNFKVQSMVINSKATYNYGIAWPRRLEEYFTLFHQNMDISIKLLKNDLGMNEQILPTNAKRFIEDFILMFNQKPSSVQKDGSKIEVTFSVPIRDHSSKFIFTFEEKLPNTNFLIEFSVFGVNEYSRWDMTAAYGVFLSLFPRVSFYKNISPSFDYPEKPEISFLSMTHGVSFTLQVPSDYKKEEFQNLITHFKKINDQITTSFNENQTTIENAFAEELNLQETDQIVILTQQSLYLNRYFIYKLVKNQPQIAFKIAVDSIKNLVLRNMMDYCYRDEELATYMFSEDSTEQIIKSKIDSKSLLSVASNTIGYLLSIDPNYQEQVAELVDFLKAHYALPSTVNTLEKALKEKRS